MSQQGPETKSTKRPLAHRTDETTLDASQVLDNIVKRTTSSKEMGLLRSYIRKKKHEKRFGSPQTASTLQAPHLLTLNKKILHALVNIYAQPDGPQVIPSVIDHWTTYSNLRSIITSGAFYGNSLLQEKNLLFTSNCLGSDDLQNLDGNVICFAPGGFVDINAFLAIIPDAFIT